MKYLYTLFLLFYFSVLTLKSHAQAMQPKVQWTASASLDSTKTNYIITIQGTIDSGWHIFAADPGGDGYLIPTIVEIEDNKAIQEKGSPIIAEIIKTDTMEAVGIVHYYENIYTWSCTVKAKPATKIKVNIQHQTCNDKMCLPPSFLEKTITL